MRSSLHDPRRREFVNVIQQVVTLNIEYTSRCLKPRTSSDPLPSSMPISTVSTIIPLSCKRLLDIRFQRVLHGGCVHQRLISHGKTG